METVILFIAVAIGYSEENPAHVREMPSMEACEKLQHAAPREFEGHPVVAICVKITPKAPVKGAL